jgi:hypothetical protein
MGYSTSRLGVLIVSVCLLSAARAALEVEPFPSGEVGAMGAPDRLIFEGCKLVSPQALRSALVRDWDVMLASSPTNRLGDYVAVVRRKVRTGYEASGFAKVEISCGADVEHGTVVVSIKEGPRYRRGAVYVTGVKAALAEKIIAKLTRPGPAENFSRSGPKEGPVQVEMRVERGKSFAQWEKGEVARFDPVSGQLAEDYAREALGELGFFVANFDAKVEIEQDAAVLHVTIADAGPPGTLNEVTVKGLTRNRPEEVLKFLGIEKGQEISLDRLQEIQRRLWDSARFKKHLLTATPSADDRSKFALAIDLEETPEAPLLTEAFSPVEQAALKLNQWLLGRLAAGEDLEFSIQDPARGDLRMHGALGPKGMALRVSVSVGPAPAAGRADPPRPPTFEYGAALTEDFGGLYALSDGKKQSAAITKSLGVYVDLDYVPAVEPDGKAKSRLNVGAGIDPSRGGVPAHVTLAPALFLSIAHAPDLKYEIHDGILTVTGRGTHVRCEVATGRLLECKSMREGISYEISARRGAMADEIAAMEKRAANGFDRAQPAGSTISFIVEQVVRNFWARQTIDMDKKARAAPVLAKLLPPEVFAPAQRLFPMGDATDSDFYIPVDGAGPDTGNTAFAFVKLILPYLDGLFDRDSWPGVLVRQSLFVAANQRKTLDLEMSRVFDSSRIGPLGYLMIGRFAQAVNPAVSPRIAERGLKHLDGDEFKKDVTVLVEGDGVAARIIRNAAEKLRGLPQADVDALADVMTPDQAKVFRQLASALRDHPDEPVERLLPAALGQLWTPTLKDSVKAALRQLSRPDEVR